MSHFMFDKQADSKSPFAGLMPPRERKPLLPTLCDECYAVFEGALDAALDAGHAGVACYCPHTECVVTVDIADVDDHAAIVCGPIDADEAKELVENFNTRFSTEIQ
jgi:hypothetical protein